MSEDCHVTTASETSAEVPWVDDSMVSQVRWFIREYLDIHSGITLEDVDIVYEPPHVFLFDKRQEA